MILSTNGCGERRRDHRARRLTHMKRRRVTGSFRLLAGHGPEVRRSHRLRRGRRARAGTGARHRLSLRESLYGITGLGMTETNASGRHRGGRLLRSGKLGEVSLCSHRVVDETKAAAGRTARRAADPRRVHRKGYYKKHKATRGVHDGDVPHGRRCDHRRGRLVFISTVQGPRYSRGGHAAAREYALQDTRRAGGCVYGVPDNFGEESLRRSIQPAGRARRFASSSKPVSRSSRSPATSA